MAQRFTDVSMLGGGCQYVPMAVRDAAYYSPLFVGVPSLNGGFDWLK